MKHEEQKISYPGFKSYWVFQETAPQESMILQILVSIISIFTSHKNIFPNFWRGQINPAFTWNTLSNMFIVHLKRVITDQNNSFYLHLWNLISKECEQNF